MAFYFCDITWQIYKSERYKIDGIVQKQQKNRGGHTKIGLQKSFVCLLLLLHFFFVCLCADFLFVKTKSFSLFVSPKLSRAHLFIWLSSLLFVAFFVCLVAICKWQENKTHFPLCICLIYTVKWTLEGNLLRQRVSDDVLRALVTKMRRTAECWLNHKKPKLKRWKCFVDFCTERTLFCTKWVARQFYSFAVLAQRWLNNFISW